ncbi:hypothetical protein WMY93_028113 [Mugilogobius chulae]|uniref:Retrotransposon gag domain-containing protein n=1 Tax=Mugilogobius chulae TaxID=88201 RepID=A0AAW0MRJ9_9GOBI
MSANVPPPSPFLPCPGEPIMPFEMWMRMFNNYLLVINATGNAWPEGRKRATLLHCLGTEGQRLFYTLPDTGDTMASAVAALEKHFAPRVNIVVERHAFRKRKQDSHESIVQYVAALRDLASKCGFDEKKDEMIRDQLIEHPSAFYSRALKALLFAPSSQTHSAYRARCTPLKAFGLFAPFSQTHRRLELLHPGSKRSDRSLPLRQPKHRHLMNAAPRLKALGPFAPTRPDQPSPSAHRPPGSESVDLHWSYVLQRGLWEKETRGKE